MLSEADYQEAVRRYKDLHVNGHERQRCQALLLGHQGYSYREVGRILWGDEETVSRWASQYQEGGLAGLKHPPRWGGAQRQRALSAEQVAALQQILGTEARPGSQGGSGGTNRAVRELLVERFGVRYSPSGMRKLFAQLGWSYQRGRKLSSRRDPTDQARYEGELRTRLAHYAQTGQPVVPLASDQSKRYLEGTGGRRWNPIGEQPLVADGARSKQAENLYGAVHLGTGAEIAPFAIDWQDRTATIRWYELLLASCPRGQLLLWQEQAAHHTREEVEDWLPARPRLEVIEFPKYTPEETPKEQTWKALKEAVSHHQWHETLAALRTAIDPYDQSGKAHVVRFLEKFGYCWRQGIIPPLSQTE